MRRFSGKCIFPLLAILLYCSLQGCFLLTPEDPPLEVKTLYPNDFAWDELDLAMNPDYYPDTPVDCASIQSILTATGRCLPKALPMGAAIECPLAYPAEKLLYACLTSGEEKVPAIYLRFRWNNTAKDIRLSEKFGTCTMAQAGPLAGEKMRYPTDPGYKVCLFEPNPDADSLNQKASDKKREEAKLIVQAMETESLPPVFAPGSGSYNPTPGRLNGDKGSERPAGLYLDFANNPETLENLANALKFESFDAPAELVLDTRQFDQTEREKAIKAAIVIFDDYRNQKYVPELNNSL